MSDIVLRSGHYELSQRAKAVIEAAVALHRMHGIESFDRYAFVFRDRRVTVTDVGSGGNMPEEIAWALGAAGMASIPGFAGYHANQP